MQAQDKVPLGEAGYMQKRLDYLDYVAAAPQPAHHGDPGSRRARRLRRVLGRGAVERPQGAGLRSASITNGSIRDIPMIAPGFQMLAGSIVPSHAYVHVVDYGIDVNVHGMAVKSGDLIHADRHGAVVVPVDKIDAMKAAVDKLAGQRGADHRGGEMRRRCRAIKAALKG